MGTRRVVSFCFALAIAFSAGMPIATAWGPHSSRAISLCALQVIRQDIERAFRGREHDLVAGAMISDRDMARYAIQSGQIEPFEPIISQIALLRRANQQGMTDYLAFRFGVLAKMTANAIQPFGIPGNEEERRFKEQLDDHIEKDLDLLKYRYVKREFIYYPVSYFRERRKFLDDAEYLIMQEYSQNEEYGEDTDRVVVKYFEDAVNAVSDVWYTVLSEREYFGEVPPSPRDVTQYYAGQVEYFLNKSRPEEAEQAYAIFSKVNPGLAAPYELLGDAFYRAGYYERAMEEYRRGLRMKGSWPEVEEKLVSHYTEEGARLVAKRNEAALQQALQAYERALEVSPDSPVAVSGREKVRAEIEAMQERLRRDRELLSGAKQLFDEANQAELAHDFEKAIDLYEKAAAVYSLVSTEFSEEHMAAQDGSEDAANKIAGIFSTVVGEAEELINRASQQELEGNYEQAITLYDGVAPALTIVKKKYSDQYQTAQRLIQSAAQKKAAAQQSLEKLKTEPST